MALWTRRRGRLFPLTELLEMSELGVLQSLFYPTAQLWVLVKTNKLAAQIPQARQKRLLIIDGHGRAHQRRRQVFDVPTQGHQPRDEGVSRVGQIYLAIAGSHHAFDAGRELLVLGEATSEKNGLIHALTHLQEIRGAIGSWDIGVERQQR